MRSAHNPPETSTRFIGWCPICQRDIKVRTGLVHHGYERPGVGYIIGDCPGVGYPPYEKSTAACDFYLSVYVVPYIRETENTLAVLNRPEGPPYLTFENYNIELRRSVRDPRTREIEMINLTRAEADELEARLPGYDKGRYSWEKRLRIAVANMESKLKHWVEERTRMDRLIADWRLQPLKTVEQEIERQTQNRAERESARTDTRNAKLEAEAAKIRKRIDSAVKNKNSAVLADVYTSSKLREISGYRITQDEALQMLDRDAVWDAFGLLNSAPATIMKKLDEMKWGIKVPRPDRGYDTLPLPWPAALGGGIAKTRGF